MTDPVEFTQDDLTAKQNDYAVFLPAISSFYANYVGRQRTENYIDAARMPAGIPDMEQLNWLNPQKGLFPYRYSLYSAGHADLDLTKFVAKEDMVRNRDPNTVMLADSGGFQIAKGVWPGEWKDPNSPEVAALMADAVAKGIELRPILDSAGNPKVDKNGKIKTIKINHAKEYQAKLDAAKKMRETVLKWQMGIATYGMTMDIPTWTFRDPKASAASGITSYDDAVNATKYNNEYWIANRYGDTKILNVLQGGDHDEAERWYNTMKDYCDPAKYEKHFNGWGMGGQNMCDVELVLKRLVHIIHDGLLESGKQDWMHFLGTSKLEWAVLLTAIQRSVRRYHNPTFTISFDCASPFLATANGQLYHNITTENRSKWSYQMSPTVDNKKYANDNRTFGDAVRQDKAKANSPTTIHPYFEDSPLSSRLKISDICYYAPGMLNKIGKEGKTSWDSFSYALLMGHNVWTHIEAVQRANRVFDSGIAPDMMVHPFDPELDIIKIIDRIFSAADRQTSLQIIEDNAKVWERVIGTRGFTGPRAVNARAMFNNLFDIHEDEIETPELDKHKLDELEESVNK
jgi:hypothetical protein